MSTQVNSCLALAKYCVLEGRSNGIGRSDLIGEKKKVDANVC